MQTDLEPYRPHYHLTPVAGWINDPNGMCYFAGKWHTFYQHNDPPRSNGYQWGHAISDDLVHWKRLLAAITPDKFGKIWSGSAVVDHHDSSGLFGGKAGMVCLFTYWDPADGRQCQGLSYSTDGITFHKHPANPVILQLRHLPGHLDDHDFRDPKVFWHEETGRWIMAVAGGKLRIFSSHDLVHWHFEHCHNDLATECPDMFPLNIDNDPAKKKWILSGGGRWYIIGEFDGKKFTPQSDRIPFTTAPDLYAGQSFDNAPNGRRIMTHWLYAWRYGNQVTPEGVTHPMPTSPWSGGSFSVPYELTLRTTRAGVRLIQQPVAEVKLLRQPILSLSDITLKPGENLASVLRPALDIELIAKPQNGSLLNLRIAADNDRFYDISYDVTQKLLRVDRRQSGLEMVPKFSEVIEMPLAPDDEGVVSLRILLDANSVEIIDAAGLTLLPAVLFPSPRQPSLNLSAHGNACLLKQLNVFRMKQAIE